MGEAVAAVGPRGWWGQWATRPNLRGNLSLRACAAASVPFAALPSSFQPHVVPPKLASKAARALVAVSGFLASLFAAVLLSSHGASAAAAAAWAVALGSFSSDVAAPLAGGSLKGSIRCGNFGLIIAEQFAALTDAVAILEAMAEVTMGRGGQSGGIATYVGAGRIGLRVRCCPGRRQEMAPLLARLLRRRLVRATVMARIRHALRGDVPALAAGAPQACGLFQGHTRFATSSLPSVGESHPHRWSPQRRVSFWSLSPSGQPSVCMRSFTLFVTHNGDFDFLELFGRNRTHQEVAAWLAHLLQAPPPARCDSASLAGVMEMFRTQGVWAHAFRLAWQVAVASSFEETVASPSASQGKGSPATASGAAAVAAVAEAVFGPFASNLAATAPPSGAPRAASLAALLEGHEAELARRIVEALQAPGSGADVASQLGQAALADYAAAAVGFFLQGDLYAAMVRLLSSAQGSFGLAASCSLDPDRIALAAWNQPMALAFCPSRGLALYGSEASALRVPLPPLPRGAPPGRGTPELTASFRIDINNNDGEVIELAFPPEEPPLSGADEAGGDPGSRSSQFSPFAPFVAAGCGLTLRAFSLRQRQPIDVSQWLPSGRIVSLVKNPYLSSDSDAAGRAATARPGAGRVENDLRDCGRVLAALRSDWDSAGSLNAQSAAALLHLLREQAGAPNAARGGRSALDVLITGTETSLWVSKSPNDAC